MRRDVQLICGKWSGERAVLLEQIIFEAEKEVEDGAEPIDVDSAMERLNKKYYG